MMKRFLFVVFTAFIACGGSNQESDQPDGSITISGKVGFPQQAGSIVLEKIADAGNFEPVATIPLSENYTYSHTLENADPGFYRLNFYNKQMVVVILDRDDVEVNVDGNSRTGFSEINGSRDHDLINQVQQIKQSLQASDEFRDINTRFQQANGSGNEELMESIRQEYVALEEGNNKKIAEAILGMKGSLASMELLRGGMLDKDKYFEVFAEVSEALSSRFPGHPIVGTFVQMVDNMKLLAVGQVAPEIELPNPDGELVKLSSLRGNYVLIDFWAKWCRPCRMENPNIVAMYKKYNDKGFEVFGVSLDRNRSDWVQAIEEDGLEWTHVSDLKYWNSEAAKQYNVTAIPFGILLDPDGVIIEKNLRGQALRTRLAELLD